MVVAGARLPGLDLVRVQDAGLSGALDPDVLEWAAREKRVLLTHDFDTLIGRAWARVRATDNRRPAMPQHHMSNTHYLPSPSSSSSAAATIASVSCRTMHWYF